MPTATATIATPVPVAPVGESIADDPQPTELAFAGLRANGDRFVLPPGRHQLEILDNDVTPADVQLTVDAPGLADSIAINDGVITVDIPADQATDVTFSYLLTVGETQSSADVDISVILPDARVAAEVPSVPDLTDTVTEPDDPSGPRTSLGPVDFDLDVPPAIVALGDLELPWWQFLATIVACSLAAIALRRRQQRTGYVAVDNVPRSEASRSTSDDGDFHLRHDTEGVWATGRQEDGRVEIQTPNGRTWIPKSRISKQK